MEGHAGWLFRFSEFFAPQSKSHRPAAPSRRFFANLIIVLDHEAI